MMKRKIINIGHVICAAVRKLSGSQKSSLREGVDPKTMEIVEEILKEDHELLKKLADS